MDIINSLTELVTSLVGVGVVCWLMAGAIIKGVAGASAGWKFWAAEFIIVITAGACYAVRLKYLHIGHYDEGTLGVYAAVGFGVAQNLHRGSEYVIEHITRLLEQIFGGGVPVLATVAATTPAMLIPARIDPPVPLMPVQTPLEAEHGVVTMEQPAVKDKIDMSGWDELWAAQKAAVLAGEAIPKTIEEVRAAQAESAPVE